MKKKCKCGKCPGLDAEMSLCLCECHDPPAAEIDKWLDEFDQGLRELNAKEDTKSFAE